MAVRHVCTEVHSLAQATKGIQTIYLHRDSHYRVHRTLTELGWAVVWDCLERHLAVPHVLRCCQAKYLSDGD